MYLSENAARDLGWEELKGRLASFCQSAPGREACLSLAPLDDTGAVVSELQAVREACDILSRRERPSLSDITDVGPDLERSVKGGTLPSSSLLNIARLVAASHLVRGFLWRRREHYPAITSGYGGLERVEGLAEEIRRVLDDTGQVKDSASPLLADLRASLLRLRESVMARIKVMLAEPLTAEMLQDSYYSLRNGRYVLPIKVNFKNQLKGIIHGSSQTGATLFIEPEQLIEPGNEIMICESRIEEENERLLSELSRIVADSAERLSANLVTLRALDVLFGKAVLAAALNCNAPEVGGQIGLREARHPLLLLRDREVVSNDIVLPEECSGLLISGPNAGGKTVLLKTVGLIAVMTAAGIPPPLAPGSRIPLFNGVFTVFGDAQDLGGDLSSFSGHMLQLREILDKTSKNTLVLLDEVASDTDPKEGAALAASIMEEIVSRGATVLATSHFHELRDWAAGRREMENASVGFDLLRLRPSFKLQMGATGESFALKIAANLGIPLRIIERAKELMGRAYQEAETLLASLKRQEEELRGAMTGVREREETARAQRERERLALEEEIRAAREEAAAERKKLLEELQAIRERAASEITRLQKSPDMKTAVDTQRWLSEVLQSVEKSRPPKPAGRTPSPGDRVEATTLGLSGTVERMDFEKREAVVLVSGKRIVVPLASLRLADGGTKAGAPVQVSGAGLIKAIESGKSGNLVQDELDLRGLFPEEAAGMLEHFLDASFRNDLDRVRVIHGHGTGAVKRAVRTHLKSSPYVGSFQAGEQSEGGDGVTIVNLKRD
jgi:DNA mismatch repair protein MutS2